MSPATKTQLDEYRDQLALLTDAMSVTRSPAPKVQVDSQFQLDLFAEENYAKRIDKIKTQVEFVHEAFDHLDEMIEEYTLGAPMAPYDRQTSDGEAFLAWLAMHRKLTKKRQDYVAVARARLHIEETAAAQRRAPPLSRVVQRGPRAAARAWIQPKLVHSCQPRAGKNEACHRRLPRRRDASRRCALFPVRRDVRTAILDRTGLALIDELDRLAPCTLHEWSARSESADPETILSLVSQLVLLGLAALA